MSAPEMAAAGSAGSAVARPVRVNVADGQGRAARSATASPLPLSVPASTNAPPSAPGKVEPLRVGQWLDRGEAEVWRKQQLSKQAAEQTARQEERDKLNGALSRFLSQGESR